MPGGRKCDFLNSQLDNFREFADPQAFYFPGRT
nr:MAG TPA: hypothetical protein [Caudoviricetes sp.]